MRDQVALQAAGVVEVELLQRLAGGEPGEPTAGATGGSVSIAELSAVIRSLGAHPSARRARVFTSLGDGPRIGGLRPR